MGKKFFKLNFKKPPHLRNKNFSEEKKNETKKINWFQLKI